MLFDTDEISTREKYRLLTNGVTPRPIAWISTRSKSGIDNLAPYSFFTVVSCDPPMLLYTQVNQRDGSNKDTLDNLLSTGECVINVVNTELMEQMNQTSASLAGQLSEFEYANIDSCPSHTVAPLSVLQAPIRYECSFNQTISLGDLPAGGTMVLLNVKAIYVDDKLLTDDGVNQQLLDSVGKMGGDSFSLTQQQVEFQRP
jgi:flavin reductase (DIM6/NTAB) family NADH-FMN oxidoreductase RutF